MCSRSEVASTQSVLSPLIAHGGPLISLLQALEEYNQTENIPVEKTAPAVSSASSSSSSSASVAAVVTATAPTTAPTTATAASSTTKASEPKQSALLAGERAFLDHHLDEDFEVVTKVGRGENVVTSPRPFMSFSPHLLPLTCSDRHCMHVVVAI